MSEISSDPRISKNTRPATPLSSKIEKTLLAYAALAGAAGVSVLALAEPSPAEIIFTAARRVIPINGTGGLDLNHDGLLDFKIIAFDDPGTNYFYPGSLKISAFGANRFVINGSGFPSTLAFGKVIGPTDGLQSGNAKMAYGERVRAYSYSRCTSQGPWRNVTNRYLGLEFSVNGQQHFGWARLSVSGFCGASKVTLTGYAYENIANKPIRAGQTSGSNSAEGAAQSVTPASLGHLAIGSAGKSK